MFCYLFLQRGGIPAFPGCSAGEGQQHAATAGQHLHQRLDSAQEIINRPRTMHWHFLIFEFCHCKLDLFVSLFGRNINVHSNFKLFIHKCCVLHWCCAAGGRKTSKIYFYPIKRLLADCLFCSQMYQNMPPNCSAYHRFTSESR